MHKLSQKHTTKNKKGMALNFDQLKQFSHYILYLYTFQSQIEEVRKRKTKTEEKNIKGTNIDK